MVTASEKTESHVSPDGSCAKEQDDEAENQREVHKTLPQVTESFTDKDNPIDTSDQPGAGSSEQTGPTTDLQYEEIGKYLMECPKCVKFAPSLSVVMKKNDQCEFSIDLHKENGGDKIQFTDKIDFTKKSTGIVDEKYCEHCKYSVATRVNNSGGFDLELSVEVPKENQLEDIPMADAQPATQSTSGNDEMQSENETQKDSRPMMCEYQRTPTSSANPKAGSKTDEPSQRTGALKMLRECKSRFQAVFSPSNIFQTRTPVKVYCIATGETFGATAAIKDQLKINTEPSSQIEETKTIAECNIIINFCPVYRYVESEVKSAMEVREVSSSGKPVILVLMHHTRDPDYPTAGYDASDIWENVFLHVHVFYHDSIRGLIKCKQNDQAIKTIKEKLQTYKQ